MPLQYNPPLKSSILFTAWTTKIEISHASVSVSVLRTFCFRFSIKGGAQTIKLTVNNYIESIRCVVAPWLCQRDANGANDETAIKAPVSLTVYLIVNWNFCMGKIAQPQGWILFNLKDGATEHTEECRRVFFLFFPSSFYQMPIQNPRPPYNILNMHVENQHLTLAVGTQQILYFFILPASLSMTS